MVGGCEPVNCARGLDSRNVTSCGYCAGNKDESNAIFDENTLPLRDLLKVYRRLGYSYIPWDGVTARPILDWDGRLFAALAGRPTDQEYAEACKIAFDAINLTEKSAAFKPIHLHHKRGDFPAVNIGVTHGIGTTGPMNHQNGQLNATLSNLLKDPNLERISSFQDGIYITCYSCRRVLKFVSAAFQLWAPKLYAYYEENLGKIWKSYPHLRPGFANSVWPCTAINFGSKVYTWPHRDCMNLSFGWCSIVALGKFDSKKGGHLVLPDLRLIIEFPSGSNILILSAILAHCNIPIHDSETRASFTQFCAGELFRYADCDLRTEKEVETVDPEQYVKLQKQKRTRWQDGLDKYTIWDRDNMC